MILASLRISGRCVEMMYDWRYLLIARFRHLSHMLSYYVQLRARLFGSMCALHVLHAYLWWDLFFV